MRFTARRYIPLIFICLFIPFLVSAQSGIVIKGNVKDAKTGESIPGVNVYLSGTTLGSTTDSLGNYRFRATNPGAYDLIFSFVGYVKQAYTLQLTRSNSPFEKDVELEPKSMELNEIEVVSSNREWKRNFTRFEREFIGQTDFADETEIKNPYIIEFNDAANSGSMVATSPKPIIVENKALGYRIFVEMDQYQWAKTGQEGFFTFYPRFEEMKPASRSERRKWEENREKVYEGSLQHFLRALYDNKINQNGFTLHGSQNLLILSSSQTRFELIGNRNVSQELLQTLKGYRLQSQVRIDYGRINKYQTSKFGGNPFNVKSSTLIPATRSGMFFIDPLGNLLNPQSLSLQGEWAKHRLAHRVPLNYIPND